VVEGYVSDAGARSQYGIVVDEAGRVDVEASRMARQTIARERTILTAASSLSSFEDGSVSRRRVARLNPRDAATAKLVENELIEFDAGRSASLRAWVRLDPSVAAGTSPIDARGLSILKLASGEAVEIRRVAPSSRAVPQRAAAIRRERVRQRRG
jgi:N-methylhydantoinase B